MRPRARYASLYISAPHWRHGRCLREPVASTLFSRALPAAAAAQFNTISGAVAATRGIVRSLWMYYGDVPQLRRMQAFYSQLIRPGDLAFDVGAHVGSRTLPWLRLGARVIAIEPVPQSMFVMRCLYGRHPRVRLVAAAVGSARGVLPMLVCEREPTVSTLSSDWAERMTHERDAFGRTRWGRSVLVPVTTLDDLIATFGMPAFCKIDVEGYDRPVLDGLSQSVPALSFEYVPPAVDLALDCVNRLQQLADYEFNWSSGESMQMEWPRWVDARTLSAHLEAYPRQGNPGDVYARVRA
jgi:FkbM family methyltransferase